MLASQLKKLLLVIPDDILIKDIPSYVKLSRLGHEISLSFLNSANENITGANFIGDTDKIKAQLDLLVRDYKDVEIKKNKECIAYCEGQINEFSRKKESALLNLKKLSEQ